jgi:hypothetical protein
MLVRIIAKGFRRPRRLTTKPVLSVNRCSHLVSPPQDARGRCAVRDVGGVVGVDEAVPFASGGFGRNIGESEAVVLVLDAGREWGERAHEYLPATETPSVTSGDESTP